MCFSAEASFITSAVLIPAGVYSLKKAAGHEGFIAIASLPVLFGVQQVFEGLLWVGLDSNNQNLINLSSSGFLFFSHWLWLFWVPLSVYFSEARQLKRRLFLLTSIVGAVYGLSLFLPLVLNSDWLTIVVNKGSIVYQTVTVYDPYIPRIVVRIIYALIILLPLLTASNRSIRHFGWIIAASVIFSTLVFAYAFISVWCFFAAGLSLFIVYSCHRLPAAR